MALQTPQSVVDDRHDTDADHADRVRHHPGSDCGPERLVHAGHHDRHGSATWRCSIRDSPRSATPARSRRRGPGDRRPDDPDPARRDQHLRRRDGDLLRRADRRDLRALQRLRGAMTEKQKYWIADVEGVSRPRRRRRGSATVDQGPRLVRGRRARPDRPGARRQRAPGDRPRPAAVRRDRAAWPVSAGAPARRRSRTATKDPALVDQAPGRRAGQAHQGPGRRRRRAEGEVGRGRYHQGWQDQGLLRHVHRQPERADDAELNAGIDLTVDADRGRPVGLSARTPRTSTRRRWRACSTRPETAGPLLEHPADAEAAVGHGHDLHAADPRHGGLHGDPPVDHAVDRVGVEPGHRGLPDRCARRQPGWTRRRTRSSATSSA
jgi:hypothetical protein